MSTQHPSNHPDDDIFELTDVVEEGGVEESPEDVNFSPDSEDLDLSFEDELEELFSEAETPARQEIKTTPQPEPKTRQPVAAPADHDLDDIFNEQETLSSEQEGLDFDALLDDIQVPSPSAATKPSPKTQAKDDDPFADLDFSDLGIDDIDLGLDEDKGAPPATAPHKRPQQPAEDLEFEQTIPDAEVVLPPKKQGLAQQDMDELLGDMDFGDLGDDDFDIDIDTEEQQVKKSHPKPAGHSLVDQDDAEDDLIADLDFSDLADDLGSELGSGLGDDLDQSLGQDTASGMDSDALHLAEDDFDAMDLSDVLDDSDLPDSDARRQPAPEQSAAPETIGQDDIDAMDFSGLKPAPAPSQADDVEFDELQLGDLTNELDEDLPDDYVAKPVAPPSAEGSQDQPDAHGERDEDFDLDGLDDLINDLDLPDEFAEEVVQPESPAGRTEAVEETASAASPHDDLDEDSLELDEQDLDDLDALLSHDSDDADLFSGIDAVGDEDSAPGFDNDEDAFLVEDLPPASAAGAPAHAHAHDHAEEEVTFLPEEEPATVALADVPLEPQAPAQQAAVSHVPDKAPEPEADPRPQNPEALAAELADLRSRLKALEARLTADTPDAASHAAPYVISDAAPNVSELVEERFSASRAAMLHDLEVSIQEKLEAALEASSHELHETLHKDMGALLRQAVSAESTAIADDVHARVEESMARKHQEDLADLGADLEGRLTGILQVDGPFMERLKQLLTPEIERIAGQLSPPSLRGVSEQALDTRLEAMRGELEERLAHEIPKAAARIIREEVAALVELMD